MTSMPGRKRGTPSLWNLLKIILAFGLLLYVLSTFELSSLAATLRNASVFWLIVAGALYFLLTLLKALQYSVLMRGKLTYPQVLNVTIWQNAVSNFFLAGAGIAAYVTMTRLEHEVQVSRSMTVFLLTKIGDLIAIWVALFAATCLVWSKIGSLQTPVVILMIGIGSAILLFFLAILFRQTFVSMFTRILEWFKVSNLKFIESGMKYLQSLANMEQHKVLATLAVLVLYSFLYLAVTVVCSYTNLRIFRLQPDFSAILFVSVLIQLVSYFPVSVFGGLGINETSSLYFWSFFDLPQDRLAPALIGIRIVFYLFNLLPLIYLPVYSIFLKPHEQT